MAKRKKPNTKWGQDFRKLLTVKEDKSIIDYNVFVHEGRRRYKVGKN